jgi:hypothetical protein
MKRILAIALAGSLLLPAAAVAGKGDAGPSSRSWEIARTLIDLSGGEFETGIRQAAGEAYDQSFARAGNPAARQVFLDLALQAMQQVKDKMLDESIDGLARGLSQEELEQYLAFQQDPLVGRLRAHQTELKAAYASSEPDGRAYMATLLSPAEQDQLSAMLRDPAYLTLQSKVRKLSTALGGPYGEEQAGTFVSLLKQECGAHPDYPWCADPNTTAKTGS